MKKHLLAITAITSLMAHAFGKSSPQPSGKEGIEWCNIWIVHAKESKFPRVLLIGDSITMGYAGDVDKQLEGKAYVDRLCTSCFDTDPALISYITAVLQSYQFDVIHLNNGMHGWGHTEEEYAQGLPAILATIRKNAPKAKLIWANTTPLNEDGTKSSSSSSEPTDAAKAEAGKLMLQADLKNKSNVRVDARNAIAAKIMQSENIPIDDLHSLVLGHPELYHGDVHFNGNGTALQATQVVSSIEKVLSH